MTSSMYDKLFVGGDLSGIQKFLYNITSKKAAVSLKGRSFYLRKLMEDICENLIKLPALSQDKPDVIYCSGGKFYVIVQNQPGILDVIGQYAKDVKAKIWNDHRGQLSINFSVVPFCENTDGSINVNGQENQKLGALWQCMTEDFARQKNQRFLDQILSGYEDFFEVIKVGGSPKICAVTGIEDDKCVRFQYKDSKDDPIWVLPSVKEQIEKGEELRLQEQFHTFEEYADKTYLGVLRMDVDGLGKLFANGFSTLAEYRAISSRLDAYFTSRSDKGYISNLQQIQQRERYKEYLNIVYAGGDDIFVVGRWDKVIDFAAEVREDFAKYVNVEGVSISGGVAIVQPKFPIAKAAEMAGEAEDTAKSYVYNGREKNAFCMFGEAVSWQDEYDYVERYKNEMVDLIEVFNMPRGILHKIMSYAAMAQRVKDGKSSDYSYIWHSAYYFTRMIERNKSNTQVVEFCKRLRDRELYGKEGKFRLLSIAARWAELTIRMNQTN